MSKPPTIINVIAMGVFMIVGARRASQHSGVRGTGRMVLDKQSAIPGWLQRVAIVLNI